MISDNYYSRCTVVDDGLADIVLIEKSIFTDFKQKQNDLERQAIGLDNKLYV